MISYVGLIISNLTNFPNAVQFSVQVLDFLGVFRSHQDVKIKLATLTCFSIVVLCLLDNRGLGEIEASWIHWVQDCQLNHDDCQVQIRAAQILEVIGGI